MTRAIVDTFKLCDYMQDNNITVSLLASKIGVSPSCMSRVINNKRGASGKVWSGLIGFFGRDVFKYIIFDVSNDT